MDDIFHRPRSYKRERRESHLLDERSLVLIYGPLLLSAVVAVLVLAALRPSAVRRRRCRGYVDLTRASRRV
jgi:hypothetical protein